MPKEVEKKNVTQVGITIKMNHFAIYTIIKHNLNIIFRSSDMTSGKTEIVLHTRIHPIQISKTTQHGALMLKYL